MADLIPALGEGARTALGFFWKSGWAFVLGYFISANRPARPKRVRQHDQLIRQLS